MAASILNAGSFFYRLDFESGKKFQHGFPQWHLCQQTWRHRLALVKSHSWDRRSHHGQRQHGRGADQRRHSTIGHPSRHACARHFGIGTLTINNTLTLGGNTTIEVNKGVGQDLVVVSSVNYGGTLTVTDLGGGLMPFK